MLMGVVEMSLRLVSEKFSLLDQLMEDSGKCCWLQLVNSEPTERRRFPVDYSPV
jgi:hypothetical protein